MLLDVTPSGQATAIIEGVFDVPAAVRLLASCEAGTMVVDFSHAGEVSNAALAFLAAHGDCGGPRLVLRGLTLRQDRLLRYLGYPGR